MELKTKIRAEAGEQQLWITRHFHLPVDLLFKAFVVPELLSRWMGTEVIELDSQPLGKYRFQTKAPAGHIVFQAVGTIHRVVENEQIVRTFEMLNTIFEPQLEFMDFNKVNEQESELQMQLIYQSVELRDQQLKLPFASGINKAHDRLERMMTGSAFRE